MSLEVRIDYADGLKHTEALGKQEPYCILQLGHSSTRSKASRNAGVRPIWNESFKFNHADKANDLIITVKNNNLLEDDLIGTVVVSLQRVKELGCDAGQYPVIDASDKARGSLQLTLTYTAPQALAPEGAASGQMLQAQPHTQQDKATVAPGPTPTTTLAPPQQQQQQNTPQTGYPTPQAGYPAPQASVPPAVPQQQAYAAPAGYPPQGYPPTAGYVPGVAPPPQQQSPQTPDRHGTGKAVVAGVVIGRGMERRMERRMGRF